MCSALRIVVGTRWLTKHHLACPFQVQVFKSKVSFMKGPFHAQLSGINTAALQQKDETRDPAYFFFNKDIQKHLMALNLRDTSKVFQRRKEGHSFDEPELKFLTQEQLQEEIEAAQRRATYFLQIPPILLPRKDIDEILSEDPELQGHDDSSFIFTDISIGVPSHERHIVVRDQEGTLRKATWSERHRMNQIYFPIEGRTLVPPKLFDPENLQSMLERSEFVFVLDRACVQFDPDDPEYIRISSITYDYIDNHRKHYALLGSRHFASMVFYLCFYNKIDNLLLQCISTYNIKDAVDIIHVFYLIQSENVNNHKLTKDSELIFEYINKFATRKSELTKVVQAYLELNIKEPI